MDWVGLGPYGAHQAISISLQHLGQRHFIHTILAYLGHTLLTRGTRVHRWDSLGSCGAVHNDHSVRDQ
jgi:hypothetical protein